MKYSATRPHSKPQCAWIRVSDATHHTPSAARGVLSATLPWAGASHAMITVVASGVARTIALLTARVVTPTLAPHGMLRFTSTPCASDASVR